MDPSVDFGVEESDCKTFVTVTSEAPKELP
jgi:hypothetical protein